jgi:hypothetical protein
MTRPWFAPPILLLALFAGCAAEPFVRPPLPVLKNPNPRAMRARLAHALPDRFTSDDTVIIQAPFRDDLAVLGVLRVNRSAGTFELVGLNQLGVKLFHLSGDSHGNHIRFAVPPLMKHKEVLLAIAGDIRRMFFDLVPEKGAGIGVGPTMLRFTQDTSEGTMVYEVGGDPPILLDKHLIDWFGTAWRVRYFQYASTTGSLYPRGIVMDNNWFHYRIIVKNLDWGVE